MYTEEERQLFNEARLLMEQAADILRPKIEGRLRTAALYNRLNNDAYVLFCLSENEDIEDGLERKYP